MKLLNFSLLIIILCCSSCNNKKNIDDKRITNLDFVKTLDSIKVKNYEDFWMLEDTLIKFIEPYTYKKHCQISNLKAERDILNNHITYFRVNDTLVGSRSTDSLSVILKNKFHINSFDPSNGCLVFDSTKYSECYEYKMNKFISKTYGNKFIDSLKNSLDSVYHHLNKNKVHFIYDIESYFLRKYTKSQTHQKWRFNLENNLIKNVIKSKGYDISEKNDNDFIIEFVIGLNNQIENIQILNNQFIKTQVKQEINKKELSKEVEAYLKKQKWSTIEKYGLKIKIQYYLHIRNDIKYPYFSKQKFY